MVSSDRGKAKVASGEEAEESFRATIQELLSQTARIAEADIVVGIPFYNEADTIPAVLKTVEKGLEEFYPDQKSVIVMAGAPAGGEALRVINTLPQSPGINRIAFLLTDEGVSGKGWGMRAIFEAARSLGADLAIVEADLGSRHGSGEIGGLAPDWIRLLLEPIKSWKMDLVISRFHRHYLESSVATLLFYPLLTAIYNCPIHDLLGGQWGISHRLIRIYLQDTRNLHSHEIGEHGIDSWLATTAVTSGARICQANLGIKIHSPMAAKAELVLRQKIKVLFDQIVADQEWWGERGIKPPLLQPLPTFGVRKTHQPDSVEVNPQLKIRKYKEGFNNYHTLYRRTLPQEIYRQLVQLASTDLREGFSAKLWAQIVYHSLLAYAFDPEFARDDLVNALMLLHNGFMAGLAREMYLLRDKLGILLPEERERLLVLEAERKIEELLNEFLHQKSAFLTSWEITRETLKPPVPHVTFREFIPGVPLVVPSQLTTTEGKTVAANDIYNAIFTRQRGDFEHFVYERLQISRNASAVELAQGIKDFLHSLEDGILPGSDLSAVEGTRKMVDFIFDSFPHEDGFSLIPEMASWLLNQYPPYTLPTKLGYSNLAEMLHAHDPLDILALASWSEVREYVESLWRLMGENLRSEHFAPCPIKALVVSHEDFPSLVEMKSLSALNKLTSRIVVSNLHKGMGGEFPRLRYLTTIAKNIVEAERFGRIWQKWAAERKEFGRKVINSIEGHWGREPLSAHNIFEDGNQRVLVERLRQMAEKVAQEADGDTAQLMLAENLKSMADSYHLAITLPDGTFVTCSAWSWASYSFKGGRALPPPLSLHVERNWTSREFLVEYFKSAGGTEKEVEEKIVELMEQGRESEDLAPILLGTEKEAAEVVSRKVIAPKQPPTGALTRFAGNPVLEPIWEHVWESKYVLNAGTIKLDGKVYLVYRAFGEDEVSRLGLAISEDGFKFTERLEEPIFEPKGKSEEKGCEDPRLTLIGDRIYMTYTAYDGIVAQIALASIGVDDFLKHRWRGWRRHGLVFPGFTDKNATIFPEQFNGKFAMLHRVDPHIWVTFSSHLRCPWPRKEHKILAGSTSGMMWDGRKIGAGAQPIKTKYGWLLITHGVDYAHVYRLGVMLLDLADPTMLLYRSPNSILEPRERYEVGEEDTCWIPNVVFTCGAVPREDNKGMLDAGDELLIYYGASDTVICIATARIGDLIPEEFR
ncbi:glycosidase [Dehalococcoidia bacterium]|nr:glycosidase [Dehalococcoidia bacterium]